MSTPNDSDMTTTNEIPPEEKKQKPRRWPWVLLGIGILIVFLAGGVGLGYLTGVQQRVAAQSTQVAQTAAQHFQYGVQMMDQGKYDLANVQFTYVLQLDPNYPGLVDKLAAVQLQLALAKTPTAAPTPTQQIVPAGSSTDDIFNQAQQDIQNKDWQSALAVLIQLRNKDLTYKPVLVDDLLYITLRSRGIDQILGNAKTNVTGGQLEQGLFNLALAEKFAPLDRDAINARQWAKGYINALAQWSVNWPMVVNQLNQVYLQLPYMLDGSGTPAYSRFIDASIGYGDSLVNNGDYCSAVTQYQNALNVATQYNRTVNNLQNIIDDATNKCHPPATKTPRPQATTEVAPTEAAPTEAPTAEPTSGG
jgi:tetratricopeptide (TPR) repeat protein